MLRVNNLKMPLKASPADLKRATAQKLNCNLPDITDFRVSKKSIDARNKGNVHFVYSVDCNDVNLNFTDKDIENLMNKVIVEVGKKTGGILR